MTEQRRIETTILKNSVQSEEFARKTIPFVKDEYFTEPDERIIFQEVKAYFEKYTNIPTAEALLINLDNNSKIPETVLKMQRQFVQTFKKTKKRHLRNG